MSWLDDRKDVNVHIKDGNASSGGIGVLGLLQVAFIILKVLGKINWSWWLVFIPTWIGLGLFVIIMLVLIGILIWSSK